MTSHEDMLRAEGLVQTQGGLRDPEGREITIYWTTPAIAAQYLREEEERDRLMPDMRAVLHLSNQMWRRLMEFGFKHILEMPLEAKGPIEAVLFGWPETKIVVDLSDKPGQRHWAYECEPHPAFGGGAKVDYAPCNPVMWRPLRS